MSRNPSLPEVINNATESALEEILTWVPGRVVRYDAATQQVDVQPIPKDRHFDEAGNTVVTTRPVVPSVPVAFPGGGGLTITFPIAVGDVVVLLFSGVSIDKWTRSGSDAEHDPETHARHSPTDAVAIPAIKAFSRPRSSVPTDCVRIGTDGAAEQGVALGEALQTFLGTLKTYLDTHIHTGVTTGGGVSGVPSILSTSVPDVASNTVKVTP